MNKIMNPFINSYKAFFILFVLCAVNPLRAQNLVPDPGFEMYLRCPDTASNLCRHPSAFIEYDLVYWFDPTCNSSDYYNTCGVYQAGAPQNQAGYQMPHGGNGYAGFNGWAYCGSFCAEYIATPLTKPLEAGKNYCVSYWVVSADSAVWASNNLGAYFSYDSAYYGQAAIHIVPQVNFTEMVIDRVNWIQLKGEFTAQGGERFMIISTFDTTGMDTVRINNYPPNIFNWSYYYIDDVEVYEADYCNWNDTLIANIFTPNGDGINDSWRMDFKNNTDHLEVYNRWGQQIARADKNNPQWNGTHNGNACAAGIYYYAGVYRNKPRKGFVQLVR